MIDTKHILARASSFRQDVNTLLAKADDGNGLSDVEMAALYLQLKPEHFERWLQLLSETVNERFLGETANKMLKNAGNIAKMMQIKIKN